MERTTSPSAQLGMIDTRSRGAPALTAFSFMASPRTTTCAEAFMTRLEIEAMVRVWMADSPMAPKATAISG